MSDWTKEPWKKNGCTIWTNSCGDRGNIAECRLTTGTRIPDDQNEVNAARIVSCVNALAGFPDPEADVQALVEALDVARSFIESTVDAAYPQAETALVVVDRALARLRREP